MSERGERFREDEADVPPPDREHLTDDAPSAEELAEGGLHELDADEINADEIEDVDAEKLEEGGEVTDETTDADQLLGERSRDVDKKSENE